MKSGNLGAEFDRFLSQDDGLAGIAEPDIGTIRQQPGEFPVNVRVPWRGNGGHGVLVDADGFAHFLLVHQHLAKFAIGNVRIVGLARWLCGRRSPPLSNADAAPVVQPCGTYLKANMCICPNGGVVPGNLP